MLMVNLATDTMVDIPKATARPETIPALGSGWIAYSFWNNGTGTPLSTFRTTWRVPLAPATQSNQTIFLFNGIQNYGANYGILQPVLQWGSSAAGGGAFWSVASWYVTSSGQAFHTQLVRVNPGDVLVGVMTLTGQSGSAFNYSCEFQDIAGTSLPVQNIAELLWCNETLEAYQISQCSDYPATKRTDFSAINILTGSVTPTVNWTPVNRVTDCGQQAVVVSNSATAGEVDINYRREVGSRISLWKVDAQGNQVNYKEHGPFPGWTPVNCAKDNVLWRHDDGRISLWKVDGQGNQVSHKEHGPYPGWTPLNCADGRVLWRHNDGRISLWKVDAQGNQVNYKEHGPFPGWTPVNCANDNVLWRHDDGRISFWVVDGQGNQVSYKEHGPFPGWTPLNCADGRILWRHNDGRISLWKVDAQGNQVNYKEHGPFPSWTPVNCANDSVLWRHDDGRISFWVVDGQGNQVNYKEHGPFPGWTPLKCADGRILWRG